MVKKLFLVQKCVIALFIAISLAGCKKDQKSLLKPVDQQNGYLDMPLDSCENSNLCLNDDLEAFVLEEEQFSGPFENGAMYANNSPGNEELTLHEYSLEQLDTKDEVQVVYFGYDAKEPVGHQQELLKVTANKAREMVKEGKVICCKGHSCQWHGTRAYNLALSNNRAHTIAGYLEQSGVPKEKIKIFGVGTEEPVAFENTKDGQAPNRRVEIYALAA